MIGVRLRYSVGESDGSHPRGASVRGLDDALHTVPRPRPIRLASAREGRGRQNARTWCCSTAIRGDRRTLAHRAARRGIVGRRSGHPRHRAVPGTRRYGVRATNGARGASANPRLRRARRRAAKTTGRHERGSPTMARAVERDHLTDGDAIANLGWRQGSILGPKLAKFTREHAPSTALADRADPWSRLEPTRSRSRTSNPASDSTPIG